MSGGANSGAKGKVIKEIGGSQRWGKGRERRRGGERGGGDEER